MLKIGVLDSGIGGLTTCCAIFRRIGEVEIEYYADNKNAPYGTAKRRNVRRAVERGTEYLISLGAEVVVLACNTATALAVSALRKRFKNTAIIGIEPALKPALSAGGKTLLLATPKTLSAKKFVKILAANSSITIADTPSLASEIEAVSLAPEDLNVLARRVARLSLGSNNLVLGCTHYCLLESCIQRLCPNIEVFDGNVGVAERMASVLGIASIEASGICRVNVYFSGRDESEKYKSVLNYLEPDLNFSVQNFKLSN
jgi:Glutamate racemase